MYLKRKEVDKMDKIIKTDLGMREVAIQALFGSHNYNLNTPESDHDYKYFVYPTLDDLYYNRMGKTSKVSEDMDYDVHDVRVLPHLFMKTNINFTEIVFSTDIHCDSEFSFMLEEKEQLASMNIPYFFNACRGMCKNKQHHFHKYSEKNKFMEEKFGYNVKEASHAYRCLNVLERYAKNDFTDFGKAIWYDDDDPERTLIMNIKTGKLTEEEINQLIADTDERLTAHSDVYFSHPVNQKVYEGFRDKIKDIVLAKFKMG